MKNKLFVCALTAFVSMTFLAGCQSQPTDTETEKEIDMPELAVPYSRGPSSPPSVKGPTTPPPGGTDATTGIVQPETEAVQPQAVTEVEEIEITMPSGTPSGSPDAPPPGA